MPESKPLHFCGAVVRTLAVEYCSPTSFKQKRITWAVVGTSLLAAFALWASVFIWAGIRFREQALFDRSIQYALGAEISTPYRNGREVIEFSRIVPGGAADKSGLRRGDVIITECHSVTQFLRSIAKRQYDCIVIPVMRDGKEIKIVLQVPLMPIHNDDVP